MKRHCKFIFRLKNRKSPLGKPRWASWRIKINIQIFNYRVLNAQVCSGAVKVEFVAMDLDLVRAALGLKTLF